MADDNFKKMDEFIRDMAKRGANRECTVDDAKLSFFGAIAQMLAAIVDELHEMNERREDDNTD